LVNLERCALRPGNVHSADGWKDALKPIVARYRRKLERRYFRADAAFANPEVFESYQRDQTVLMKAVSESRPPAAPVLPVCGVCRRS
jgi:hypothetical protein